MSRAPGITDDHRRAVALWAADVAAAVLPVLAAGAPDDPRAQDAVEGARGYGVGGPRTAGLRALALAAFAAAREVSDPGASAAARAAGSAAAVAYLHDLASPHQVTHVLAPVVHAALAKELAGGGPAAADAVLRGAVAGATPLVRDAVDRLPPRRIGRSRQGRLYGRLDDALRSGDPGRRASGMGPRLAGMTDTELPDDWHLLDDSLVAWFAAPSHAAGADLVRRALDDDAAGIDLDLRSTGVLVTLTTADTAAAQRISSAATSLGLTADPSVPSRLSVVLEAQDVDAVTDFWRTAAAYEQTGAALADPVRRNPSIRLLATDEHRPLRNRLHVDVSRPVEQAHEAITAVAPGAGRSGEEWAFYATVPDAEGNEVDLVPLVAGSDRLGDDERTSDWRAVFGAMAHYPVRSRSVAADLVSAVAELADAAGVPVLVDVRPGGVVVDSGKDVWEVDDRFAALAAQVQAAACGLGLTADASALRYLQVGVDAVDVPAVREFWRAVLGYVHDPRDFLTDLVDPRRLGAVLFFQPMSADETDRRGQRNRMHLGLDVPADQAQRRIDLALANGGTVLHADEAAGRWVLTDPEGNELYLRAG